MHQAICSPVFLIVLTVSSLPVIGIAIGFLLLLFYTIRLQKGKSIALKHYKALLTEKEELLSNQQKEIIELQSQSRQTDEGAWHLKKQLLAQISYPMKKILGQLTEFSDPTSNSNALHSEVKALLLSLFEWESLANTLSLGTQNPKRINAKMWANRQADILQSITDNLGITFDYRIDVENDFVQLDLLRANLMVRYAFSQFIQENPRDSSLFLDISQNKKGLRLQLTAISQDMDTLQETINPHKPHYHAIRQLARDSSSFLEWDYIGLMTLLISFSTAKKSAPLEAEPDPDKSDILVYAHEVNKPLVEEFFSTDRFNVVIESQAEELPALFKKDSYKAFGIYEEEITPQLAEILLLETKLAQNKMPWIFLSEALDKKRQEKIKAYGFDLYLQLPCSKDTIARQIQGAISQKTLKKKTVDLAEELHSFNSSEPNHTSLNKQFIDRALSLIRKHLDDPEFNVGMLQELMPASKAKCYRNFKQVLNSSPSDIILKMRMEKAKSLLNSTALNISEVCFESGFKDPKYFSKSFKKTFGKSPKKYKELILLKTSN